MDDNIQLTGDNGSNSSKLKEAMLEVVKVVTLQQLQTIFQPVLGDIAGLLEVSKWCVGAKFLLNDHVETRELDTVGWKAGCWYLAVFCCCIKHFAVEYLFFTSGFHIVGASCADRALALNEKWFLFNDLVAFLALETVWMPFSIQRLNWFRDDGLTAVFASIGRKFFVILLTKDLTVTFKERFAGQWQAANALTFEVVMMPRFIERLDGFLKNFFVAVETNWYILIRITLKTNGPSVFLLKRTIVYSGLAKVTCKMLGVPSLAQRFVDLRIDNWRITTKAGFGHLLNRHQVLKWHVKNY